jgi:hypothetical protein
MDLVVDINIGCETNPFYGILRVLYANSGKIERKNVKRKFKGAAG